MDPTACAHEMLLVIAGDHAGQIFFGQVPGANIIVVIATIVVGQNVVMLQAHGSWPTNVPMLILCH